MFYLTVTSTYGVPKPEHVARLSAYDAGTPGCRVEFEYDATDDVQIVLTRVIHPPVDLPRDPGVDLAPVFPQVTITLGELRAMLADRFPVTDYWKLPGTTVEPVELPAPAEAPKPEPAETPEPF